VHIRNPDGESRTALESGVLDQALEEESRDGLAERGYLPIAAYEKSAQSECFVIALRKPAAFLSDRGSGKLPGIGGNCSQLPLYIYWESNQLHYESRADHPELEPRR